MTDKQQPAQFDWATELSDVQGRVTLSEQEAHEIGARLRSLGAYCMELEAQVIRDCMTNVQNPAEIEHVAGDVSKNGAESNMSAQQPAPAPQPLPKADSQPAPDDFQPCASCFGTGVEGDADDYGRTIDVTCGECNGSGRAPADSVLEDAARLDWLLLHISGAEFRRIGVHYSGNARRADVDAARKQGGA